MSAITAPAESEWARMQRARRNWLLAAAVSLRIEPDKEPAGFWRDAGRGVEQWVVPR